MFEQLQVLWDAYVNFSALQPIESHESTREHDNKVWEDYVEKREKLFQKYVKQRDKCLRKQGLLLD